MALRVIVLLLFISASAFAQYKRATTLTGEKVRLHADGTWEYAPDEPVPPPDPRSVRNLQFKPIDIVANDHGEIVSLAHNGLEFVDPEKFWPKHVVFDPKSTVWALPPFSQSENQALALDTDGRPVILWSGERQDGAYESYLTIFGDKESVQLDKAFEGVVDFAVSANGRVYIFGYPAGEDFFTTKRTRSGHERPWIKGNPDLVHEFSRDGAYIRSFHPWPNVPNHNPSDARVSTIATQGDNVFVLQTPVGGGQVHEYRDGAQVNVYDFPKSDGWQTRPRRLFAASGRIYLSSILLDFTGPPQEAPNGRMKEYRVDRLQLHILSNGEIRDTAPGLTWGTPIGLTPDGNLLAYLNGDEWVPGRGNRPGVFRIKRRE